jgi:hypothetical protein
MGGKCKNGLLSKSRHEGLGAKRSKEGGKNLEEFRMKKFER